jgi:excinuclease ABC subunit C
VASQQKTYDHKKRLQTIPQEPGVYLMKDKRGKIIYIGKSINLRARVRSYFSGSDPRPFVRHLPRVLGDIEVLVTETEEEALQLEAALIRRHLPRYNIKIARSGVWLRLDLRQDWPRVELVRHPQNDGARYFGEYTSGRSAWRTMQLLERHFLLRTCDDSTMSNRSRPCMQYQIKRCLAPCVVDVQRVQYRAQLQQVILFLEGRTTELRQQLEEQMWEASERLDFEVAARLRDQIQAVDAALNRYEITDEDRIPRDVVGMHREGERVTFKLLVMRDGRMRESESFHFTGQEFPDEEILSSFLHQLYISSGRREIPQELLLPLEIEDGAPLGRVLSAQRGAVARVLGPARQDEAQSKLVLMATRNVLLAFQKHHTKKDRVQEQLSRLQKRLRLRRAPGRMECFDISNLHESAIVAGMVVFARGEPRRSAYRSFRIRRQGQDDFASIREAVTRRFKRSLEGNWPLPDLLIIDGGKGQLGAAVAAMADLGVSHVPVISLAKSRRKAEPGGQGEGQARTPERVFVPGRSNPIILKRNSPELLLLQHIRDEAHHHALRSHRKLRRRLALKGSLEAIDGVGPSRRRELLKHFGSVERVSQASAEELERLPCVSPQLAARIVEAFSAQRGQATGDAGDTGLDDLVAGGVGQAHEARGAEG